MAQRTIHYLFGELISRQIELTDKQRFLLGSIMPDAIEPCDRDKSHFKVRTDAYVFYDFDAYRNQYLELILQDDLYLGYYMHLVEDVCYRAFVYQDCFTMPRNSEEVKLLHNDYHILNSYIVSKYGICNMLHTEISLENEPIRNIAAFRICQLQDDLADDFSDSTEGSTVFLTERMLDEFMDKYFPLAVEEIKNLKNGISILRAHDYAWLRRR